MRQSALPHVRRKYVVHCLLNSDIFERNACTVSILDEGGSSEVRREEGAM